MEIWSNSYVADNFHIIPPAKLDDAVKICDTSNTDDERGVDYISFTFDADTTDDLYKIDIADTTAVLAGS